MCPKTDEDRRERSQKGRFELNHEKIRFLAKKAFLSSHVENEEAKVSRKRKSLSYVLTLDDSRRIEE